MNPSVRTRSATRGRLRLHVPALVAHPGIAEPLERLVRNAVPGSQARATPVSGSLLVTYDFGRVGRDLPESLRSLIGGWLSDADPSGRPGAHPAPNPLARVLDLSREHPGTLLGPAALSVSGYTLNTLQNLSYAGLVLVAGGGVPSILEKLGITDSASEIKVLAKAAAALTAGTEVVSYHRRKAWRRVSQAREHRLRTELFSHLEEMDLAFFEEHGTGQLTALFAGDIAQVGRMLEGVDGLIEASLTILLAGIALLSVSPWLALVAATSIPLMFVPMRLLKSRTQPVFAGRAVASGDLNQMLDNVFGGIVEVKSFTAEGVEADRVEAVSETLAEYSVASTAWPALSTVLAGGIYYAGYTPALAYAVGRVIGGTMSQEKLALATFWYPQLVGALGRIQDLSETYYGAKAAADRICTVLDTKPRIRSGPRRLRPMEVRGEIIMERVTFGYDPEIPVLRDLSLSVEAGQSLGVVGPTGSGKSTLLRLLMRFYDPQAGRIFLDGHDLRDLDLGDLRRAIALVSQDVYLFQGTVAHNVGYGRPDATPEDIHAALAASGAGQLLEALPDGLRTDVGERGHRLSGGQRQRVAIARALLKGAPILALDEATSHLDYATEAAVKASLRSAMEGRTTFLVAHRLSTVRDADRILVLGEGTIQEQGRHEELLAHGGIYANLWRRQS